MVFALQLMWCCSSTKYSNKAKDVDTCKSLDTSPQCSMFKIMEHLQEHFRLKGTLKNLPLITFERFLSNMNYLACYKVWILTKHIEMVIKLVRFLPITDNLVVSESICKKTLQHSWYLNSFFPLWILQWIVRCEFSDLNFFWSLNFEDLPTYSTITWCFFFPFFFFLTWCFLSWIFWCVVGLRSE